MTNRIHFLNSDVREALKYDLSLYACYRQLSDAYDDERDPIHNYDYVNHWRKQEAECLEKAKKLRDECMDQMLSIRFGAE